MTLGLHIAQRIKELRKQQGLSQEQLATKADMEATVLSRIERGQNPNIQVNTLDKIISALGVPYQIFFSFTDTDDQLSRVVGKISLTENEKDTLELLENILDWKLK
ncbi:TPA: helix-turn-helix transcriptional regulator [Streptococcus suis]|uniref:helix-turn-helix domain-containing protein n=1 Tax=Streptococcus suis TaxID=1307 RepID=UPI00041AECF4|nr:helix-turn-helix transcriptional regulator [Streptococcus suis]HEM3173501.1 helix-turn-helix transcriptional regulator [Streptococcus suis]HEM4059402.1 helix-turn-helix transcriptional regulator [Streptococcus suis]